MVLPMIEKLRKQAINQNGAFDKPPDGAQEYKAFAWSPLCLWAGVGEITMEDLKGLMDAIGSLNGKDLARIRDDFYKFARFPTAALPHHMQAMVDDYCGAKRGRYEMALFSPLILYRMLLDKYGVLLLADQDAGEGMPYPREFAASKSQMAFKMGGAAVDLKGMLFSLASTSNGIKTIGAATTSFLTGAAFKGFDLFAFLPTEEQVKQAEIMVVDGRQETTPAGIVEVVAPLAKEAPAPVRMVLHKLSEALAGDCIAANGVSRIAAAYYTSGSLDGAAQAVALMELLIEHGVTYDKAEMEAYRADMTTIAAVVAALWSVLKRLKFFGNITSKNFMLPEAVIVLKTLVAEFLGEDFDAPGDAASWSKADLDISPEDQQKLAETFPEEVESMKKLNWMEGEGVQASCDDYYDSPVVMCEPVESQYI